MDCTFAYLEDPMGAFDDTVRVNRGLATGQTLSHWDTLVSVQGVLYEVGPVACVP